MNDREKRAPQEKPPLFRKWRSWYLLEVTILTLNVVLFYLITRFFQ